jgi:hypothetical protein
MFSNARQHDVADFDRSRWRDWVVVAWAIPDGDVLPVRAYYGPSGTKLDERSGAAGAGLEHRSQLADQPIAYALCDLIASKLHTERALRIIKAIRFVPAGGCSPT